MGCVPSAVSCRVPAVMHHCLLQVPRTLAFAAARASLINIERAASAAARRHHSVLGWLAWLSGGPRRPQQARACGLQAAAQLHVVGTSSIVSHDTPSHHPDTFVPTLPTSTCISRTAHLLPPFPTGFPFILARSSYLFALPLHSIPTQQNCAPRCSQFKTRPARHCTLLYQIPPRHLSPHRVD
jgi:hypothetical protein